jgi:[ribosomal protein S5]-alanine N-acetyltransferase
VKPTLHGPTVRLRPLRPDDAEAMARVFGDPRRPAFLGPREPDPEVHRDNIRRRLADGDLSRPLGSWAVEAVDTGEVVGLGLLKPLDGGPDIEVGWHLDPGHWRRGYASAAGRLLLRYGFETLGLAEIVAVVVPENEASRRVVRALGMRAAGLSRAYGVAVERFVLDRVDRSAP